MTDIHEGINRLVLRRRWILWSLRNYRPGDYFAKGGRHIMLSERLHKWKPILKPPGQWASKEMVP